MRIVRIGDDRWLNLDYLILAEKIKKTGNRKVPAAMRTFLMAGIVRDLDSDEAERLKAHLVELEEDDAPLAPNTPAEGRILKGRPARPSGSKTG